MSGLETINTGFCDGVVHPVQGDHEAMEADIWGTNDSGLEGYALGDVSRPRPLLAQALSHLAHHPAGMGIDIAGGANGIAMQQMLERGIVRGGVVTNYRDHREESTRAISEIDHIDGDIIDPKTWHNISAWREANAPEGFSVVLHRPAGALQDLPTSFYRGAIHSLIDLTMPDGVLYVQLPRAMTGLAYEDLPLREVCTSIRRRKDVGRVFSSTNRALIYKRRSATDTDE